MFTNEQLDGGANNLISHFVIPVVVAKLFESCLPIVTDLALVFALLEAERNGHLLK